MLSSDHLPASVSRLGGSQPVVLNLDELLSHEFKPTEVLLSPWLTSQSLRADGKRGWSATSRSPRMSGLSNWRMRDFPSARSQMSWASISPTSRGRGERARQMAPSFRTRAVRVRSRLHGCTLRAPTRATRNSCRNSPQRTAQLVRNRADICLLEQWVGTQPLAQRAASAVCETRATGDPSWSPRSCANAVSALAMEAAVYPGAISHIIRERTRAMGSGA